MYARVEKSKENKSKASSNSVGQKRSHLDHGVGCTDHRLAAVMQQELPAMNNRSMIKEVPLPDLSQSTQIKAVANISGKTVQLKKAELLDEMPKDVKQAIEFLNDIHDLPSISDFGEIAREQIELLEKSDYAQHCKDLIAPIKKKLPQPKAPASPLKEKIIHSIWVQGNYRDNEELQDALETRKNSKAEGWKNLIWVYETEKKESPQEFSTIDDMVVRPVNVQGLDMQEVDFSQTMALWKDKPAWVLKFIPLLDLLFAKKSFVTMSDIMRMIILYYKGGLYQDVKIHLKTPNVEFFDQPLVNTDVLQLVDGGPNKENWAMIANAGCQMIEDIMEATLRQFPKPSKISTMPENYANDGQYSKAHVYLHDDKGPWNRIEAKSKSTDRISDVNPSLKLENPRPVNSWAHTDGVEFNWDSESTRQAPLDASDLDKPGRTFGSMATEIERSIDQREKKGYLSRTEADHLRDEFRPLVENLIMQSIDKIQNNPSNVESIMAAGIKTMNAIIDKYI